MRLTISTKLKNLLLSILARSISSSWNTIWTGCAVIGIAYFFVKRGTILNYVIVLLVFGITGQPTGRQDEWVWLDAARVMAVTVAGVAAFALPALATVTLVRRFVSDRVISVLVGAWLACYIYMLMVGPVVEGF